jgi:hypothetical protein
MIVVGADVHERTYTFVTVDKEATAQNAATQTSYPTLSFDHT